MSLLRTYLQDYLADQTQQERQARWLDAYGGAQQTVENQQGVRAVPGMQGPGAPVQQFDPRMFAENLIQQGDPAGLQFLGQTMQMDATAANQQAGDVAAMERAQLAQAGQDRRAQAQLAQQRAHQEYQRQVDQFGRMFPVVEGTPDWFDLEREATDLMTLTAIQQELANTVRQEGTTFWDTGRIEGLLNEGVQVLARQGEAGALQQADIDFYTQALGDPTGFTPEWVKRNRGRLGALRERINRGIESWRRRAAYAVPGSLPDVRAIPSQMEAAEEALPEGYAIESPDDIEALQLQLERDERAANAAQRRLDQERARASEWRGY